MSAHKINLIVFHFILIQVFLWNFAQQFNQNNQKMIDAISASVFFSYIVIIMFLISQFKSFA